MFAIFPNGKVLNLNLVTLIEPQEGKENVKFRFTDGLDITMEMDNVQLRALIIALQHDDPIHHVIPTKKEERAPKIDFSDFPSVLEGENSPA